MEGVAGHGPKKLTLRKRHFFVIEKYVEDVKQNQKDVPDLVELIMRPTDPVKQELRRILFKTSQYRPESSKSGFQLFGCLENRQIPARGQHSPLA